MLFLKILVGIRGPLGLTNAPRSNGPLPDMWFSQGSGPHTIETAFNFSGSDLTFSLESGGDMASIDRSNGIITVGSENIFEDKNITVKADNNNGSAKSSFKLSVKASGIGYWKIEEDFIVG